MYRIFPAALALACLAGQPALADDAMPTGSAAAGQAAASFPQGAVQASAGDITVSDGWVRATLPGQKTAAGYLTLANRGDAADRLVSVTSTMFPRIEIHTMKMEGDVMIMRPVEEGLAVPAGGTVHLDPQGGLHLMLLGVTKPLTEGDEVEMELRFEHAGPVRLTLQVRKASGGM